MTENSYEGMLEDWKAKLMIKRARTLGFRGEALDDALQDLALVVAAFKFDPERAQGMSEESTLAVVMDNFLRNQLRAQKRRQRRDDADADYRGRNSVDFVSELNMQHDADINAFARDLKPFHQEVLHYLREGKDLTWVANKLDVRWQTVQEATDKIAANMAHCGIIPPDYLQST